jgi:hypothetical protein
MSEVLAERSANTATFQQADGSFTAIVADTPLHYRDAQGAWQIINPAFEATPDSFLVQHNAIRSRAGTKAAWLSAESASAVVIWQASELGLIDAAERWPAASPSRPSSPDATPPAPVWTTPAAGATRRSASASTAPPAAWSTRWCSASRPVATARPAFWSCGPA